MFLLIIALTIFTLYSSKFFKSTLVSTRDRFPDSFSPFPVLGVLTNCLLVILQIHTIHHLVQVIEIQPWKE